MSAPAPLAPNVVGRGFLAQACLPLAQAHPRALFFAAGVSHSGCTEDAEFRREAALLYQTIEHCRQSGGQLVYFSTASVLMYGGAPPPGREDGPVFPLAAYARHKVALENVLRLAGINFLVLRVASPVGPQQKEHQLIPALCEQIEQGSIRLFRGASRDLIDIDDVIEILRQLLARGVQREVVNVASGVAVPVEAIVAHLEARLGLVATKSYVERPGGPYRVCLDKLARLLGGMPPFARQADYYQRVLDRLVAARRAPSAPTPPSH